MTASKAEKIISKHSKESKLSKGNTKMSIKQNRGSTVVSILPNLRMSNQAERNKNNATVSTENRIKPKTANQARRSIQYINHNTKEDLVKIGPISPIYHQKE